MKYILKESGCIAEEEEENNNKPPKPNGDKNKTKLAIFMLISNE